MRYHEDIEKVTRTNLKDTIERTLCDIPRNIYVMLAHSKITSLFIDDQSKIMMDIVKSISVNKRVSMMSVLFHMSNHQIEFDKMLFKYFKEDIEDDIKEYIEYHDLLPYSIQSLRM